MNKEDLKIIVLGIVLVGAILSGTILYMIEQNRPEVSYYAIGLAIALGINQIIMNRRIKFKKTINKIK